MPYTQSQSGETHLSLVHKTVYSDLFLNCGADYLEYLSFSFKVHVLNESFWIWKAIQGVPKNETEFMLSNQVSNFQIFFFLLKIEIHTKILNTKPFLCNFRGLWYFRNKMWILIRWLWSKLKLIDLELPYIWKIIGANFEVLRPLWDSMNMNWSVSEQNFVL